MRRCHALPLILAAALALAACGPRESDETPPAAAPSAGPPDGAAAATADDPYIWLEEVEGAEALAWAAERNALSTPRLQGDPRFEEIRAEIEAVLTSDDRIPTPSLVDGRVYNFWQDDRHVRGILRRVTLAGYASDEPQWETVLDVDNLAAVEGANWVYKGRTCLPDSPDRCLLRLSDGGKDAVVIREFDMTAKNFVDGGFYVAEAKTGVDWLDRDTLVVGTDFGEGSLTASGYARTLRLWRRGTPIDEAERIIQVDETDMAVGVATLFADERNVSFVIRQPDFFTEQSWLLSGEGTLAEIPLPEDADLQGLLGGRLIVLMRSDWSPEGGGTFRAGSLISMDLAASVGGGAPAGVATLLDPASDDALDAVDGVAVTAGSVYVSALKDVAGALLRIRPDGEGWRTERVDLPAGGALRLVSADAHTDAVMVSRQSFLSPSTLYLIGEDGAPEAVKSLEPRFDAGGLVAEQRFAASADGTRIPYFVVRPRDAPMDGGTPVRLTAYGGFEISRTPAYMSAADQAWLRRGGAWALANIRGGGEYGPAWHQAGLRENRQRVFDDFIAVAEALIDSGLTSPRRLGVSGGSNGGLLVAAVMTQRPDLYNAVISAVPLIDMLRYHRLLAGASWTAEYGDPDIPEHAEFIRAYSPYQRVSPDAAYPEIFLWTNPKDDRVHPGHARKMAARMLEQGHPVIYFESAEGGHGGGANLAQLARTGAMEVVYLLQKLADG